ncbi:MAG: hypothetical protein NWE92_08685 [Candidatus Bathyarchaeota archaeon]|nr:hypothetical protein [Candidatus Bathyarchaeota archaeon]
MTKNQAQNSTLKESFCEYNKQVTTTSYATNTADKGENWFTTFLGNNAVVGQTGG